MKMKMNTKKMGPAVTRQCPLVLIVFIVAFLFGTHAGLGQKRFMLDQNEAHKFKIAKQLYPALHGKEIPKSLILPVKSRELWDQSESKIQGGNL